MGVSSAKGWGESISESDADLVVDKMHLVSRLTPSDGSITFNASSIMLPAAASFAHIRQWHFQRFFDLARSQHNRTAFGNPVESEFE